MSEESNQSRILEYAPDLAGCEVRVEAGKDDTLIHIGRPGAGHLMRGLLAILLPSFLALVAMCVLFCMSRMRSRTFTAQQIMAATALGVGLIAFLSREVWGTMKLKNAERTILISRGAAALTLSAVEEVHPAPASFRLRSSTKPVRDLRRISLSFDLIKSLRVMPNLSLTGGIAIHLHDRRIVRVLQGMPAPALHAIAEAILKAADGRLNRALRP